MQPLTQAKPAPPPIRANKLQQQPTPKHFTMQFTVSGIHAADKLRDKIRACGIEAETRFAKVWIVKTDTRILAHAAELTRFISGGLR